MRKFLSVCLLLFLLVLIAFPLLYAFSASLFSMVDFTDSYAHFFPSKAKWDNYIIAIGDSHFIRYLLNSIITSLLATMLRVIVLVLAAFSFTHLKFKGKKCLLILLFATVFIPPDAMLYDNYRTIAKLGLLNTYPAIILPSIFSASALSLIMAAYITYDRNIYDAASIDGASDSKYIASILLPLTEPVTITVAIQALIGTFNSYLWPLLVTNRDEMRTVQVGLTMLGFAEEAEQGAEYAAIILITMPFLILLFFMRKSIEKAINGGMLY